MRYANERDVAIHHCVHIKNPPGISRIQAYLSLPLEYPIQKNLSIEYVSPPSYETLDLEGNTVAFFESISSINLDVVFHYTAYEEMLERGETKDLTEEEHKKYTRDDLLIEINDHIKSLAQKIVGGESNPLRQATLLFTWVVETIHYKRHPKKAGNLTALKERKGDCGDMSFLFISLCRALNIPARAVFGWWTTGHGREGPHAWAECFIEEYGWIPVDCSAAQMVRKANKRFGLFSIVDWTGIPKDPDYYFGSIDNQRLIYSKGTGLELPHEHLAHFDKEKYKEFEMEVNGEPFIFGKANNGKILWLQPIYFLFEREDEDNMIYPSFDSNLKVTSAPIKRTLYMIYLLAALLIMPTVLLKLVFGIGVFFFGTFFTHMILAIVLWSGVTRIFYTCIVLVTVIFMIFVFL
jgi:hypothetical protein